MLRAWVLLVVLSFVALPTALAHGPDVTHDAAAELNLFPSAAEIERLVHRVAEHPWAELHVVAHAGSGKPLHVLEITDRDSDVPMHERVVTLLLTQQHGNEPAGTGAAHDLLEDFLDGTAFRGTLHNQVLLLLPMANPDGADAGGRTNKDGVDINRDHVGLTTPEARGIHAVLDRWDVHVAMDHHEYGGLGFGNPVPLRIYDYDLTTLFPRHGNVREPTQTASEELMYDALWPRAEEAGYTVNHYGQQTVAGIPVAEVAGGPDPGILRNNLGLNNVAGLLIETRVDSHPNPFHDAERRIAIHRLVMEVTLAYASEHAERFIQAKRASEQRSLMEPAARYMEGERGGFLPNAFWVLDDVNDLFEAHGLAAGVPHPDGGFVHSLQDERQGLIAALLHPESSRSVADARPAEELVGADAFGPAAADDLAVPAPVLLPVLALALVGLLLSRRGKP